MKYAQLPVWAVVGFAASIVAAVPVVPEVRHVPVVAIVPMAVGTGWLVAVLIGRAQARFGLTIVAAPVAIPTTIPLVFHSVGVVGALAGIDLVAKVDCPTRAGSFARFLFMVGTLFRCEALPKMRAALAYNWSVRWPTANMDSMSDSGMSPTILNQAILKN